MEKHRKEILKNWYEFFLLLNKKIYFLIKKFNFSNHIGNFQVNEWCHKIRKEGYQLDRQIRGNNYKFTLILVKFII